MEVSGAGSIHSSCSYQSDQSKTVKERAVSVTLHEATTVFNDIADHISRLSFINVPNPNEQQQRWNTCYAASKDIVSGIGRMLNCVPDLCVVYYTATSKPAGLMTLDKEGELDGCRISGMITDFTKKGIGKKLTEYAVNFSYSKSSHDGKVYLKIASLDSQEIFRSIGFIDKNGVFLFLNPRESVKWELRNDKWSLKADHTLSQAAIENEKKSVAGSSDKLESPTPFTYESLVKNNQLRSQLLFPKKKSTESVVNEKNKFSEIPLPIKSVVEGAKRLKYPRLSHYKKKAPNVVPYESRSRQIKKT